MPLLANCSTLCLASEIRPPQAEVNRRGRDMKSEANDRPAVANKPETQLLDLGLFARSLPPSGESEMQLIRIWFDGGSLGNPGTGYGSYEIDGGTMLKHKSIRQEFGPNLTCNQAEYFSLLAALKWLIHNLKYPDQSRLEIFTDSMIVRNQVARKWKSKVLHLRELRDLAVDLLSRYGHWEIKWHSRNFNVQRFGH